MSQRKTGVFSLGGRLTKSVATSAFALSALAGGVMLSGGEVKAAICSFAPGSPCVGSNIPTEIITTDKLLSFISGPSGGVGDVEFKWVDVNANGTWYNAPADFVDEWHVDVDFNPDLQANSVLEYIVKIDTSVPHLPYFQDVTLGSIIGPGNGTVTKDIYTVVSGGQGVLIGSILNQGTYTLTPNTYSELYIVDTVNAGTSTIDAYQNVYRQTPGPLPILGAGAAFGFSRKLRSRIKGVHAA
jgi:hypothetical protein